MNKKPVYTLKEISSWQENREVSLPNVQRGFVWKPSQIENLWDSLLRGFPIGAFVLSPNINDKLEILDGQQRATSICLGFGNKTFRGSENKIKVFIDLERPKGDDNRKYVFRVITRSHPWGYRKKDNSKTLTAENIRKAMVLYNIEDYLDADLDKFYPFDASFPIPFEILLNSRSIFEAIEALERWEYYPIIKNNAKNKKVGELSNVDEIKKRVEEVFNRVKFMLDSEDGQRIPALYLDFDKFRADLNNDISINKIEANELLEDSIDDVDEDSDEIENLFIRLNAGGTPLRGEELNYSILKAHIHPDFQIRIEKTCSQLFRPSRFITIAYRLYQNYSGDEQNEARTMRIKAKQFQKTMDSGKENFEKFLINMFEDKRYLGMTLLEYIFNLIKYDKQLNPRGLPYLMVVKIASEAPEIMFMLLYRTMISNDLFPTRDRSHRKMLGMVTLFTWFGKGENLKDHSKLLASIWESVKSKKKDNFWSYTTVQFALDEKTLVPFPTYNAVYDRKSLIQLKKFKDGNVIEKFHQKTGYKLFLNKLIYNKDILLYAQREFLSSFFHDKQYQLDDTNVPFDWDHISAQKYILRKWKIKDPIKQWYNTNGNFRAWPYSLNRMDQDSSPANKLNPSKKENWKDLIDKKIIPSEKEINKYFLQWSFCSHKWNNCLSTDMKKDWEKTFELIIDRNLEICKEWYDSLLIEELRP